MKSKKILVVDDSPTQALRSKLVLESLDFTVIEANNGKSAFEIALQENPDVIISDILMPEMDGFELTHLIQVDPRLQHIPIILQTASYRAKEDKEFGMDIGADAFIPKGADAEEITNVINRVVANKINKIKNGEKGQEEPRRPFDALHAQRMLFRLLEETAKLEQANASIEAERNRAQKYLEVASVIMVAIDCNGNVTMINSKGCEVLGGAAQEIIGVNWCETFIPKELQEETKWIYCQILEGKNTNEYFENEVVTRGGDVRLIAWHNTVLTDDFGELSGVLSSGEDITERKQAEERIRKSEAELAELYKAEQQRVERLSNLQKISSLLAGLHSQNDVLEMVAIQARDFFNSNVCFTLTIDDEHNTATIVAQSGLNVHSSIGLKIPLTSSILQHISHNGKPVIIDHKDQDAVLYKMLNLPLGICCIHLYPIIQKSQIYGFILHGFLKADVINKENMTTMELLAERTASALNNAKLFEEINNNLKRLAALRSIDQAITNSMDINFTMGIVLEQTVEQLKVHAADILLLEQDNSTLKFAIERGFNNPPPSQTKVSISNSAAGNAVLERDIIHVKDLSKESYLSQKYHHFAKEGFVSLVCAPLIAKGQVKGVMEIFHRDNLTPDADWLSFLDTLARQAAIAIDNADLFTNLQRTNMELTLAYDATIQGWSDALDLRDKETEGHTQRVTDMTMQLAKLMGVDEKEKIHIWRGALLHDIGKMGIPDSILLKPGKLSDEEWEIMRKHPRIAYDLISPIAYLRPALDIPYCHHEKWDGTGYPRGLREEQIPLSARIFSIVDVWDALTSDRPYRNAWSREKTLDYIMGLKGSHFDEKVVDNFLIMINKD